MKQTAEEEDDDYGDGFDPLLADFGAHGDGGHTGQAASAAAAAAAAAMGAMSVLLPPLDVGRHGIQDVHFAVKGLLNAKSGEPAYP